MWNLAIFIEKMMMHDWIWGYPMFRQSLMPLNSRKLANSNSSDLTTYLCGCRKLCVIFFLTPGLSRNGYKWINQAWLMTSGGYKMEWHPQSHNFWGGSKFPNSRASRKNFCIYTDSRARDVWLPHQDFSANSNSFA